MLSSNSSPITLCQLMYHTYLCKLKVRRAVAYLAKGPTHNRAARAVWLGQIQLVFACVAEPFAPGDPSHCIAGLMHCHITPLPITQQDLIPAWGKHILQTQFACTHACIVAAACICIGHWRKHGLLLQCVSEEDKASDV